MSCYWHVHCRTCTETYHLNDANRDPGLATVRLLVKHASAIVALAPLIRERDSYGIELRHCHYGWIDPEWFLKHTGHDLTAISEYGDLDT